MKSCSTALATHIAGGQTTLTTLWLIKRTDGTVFGTTEFDEDITFQGTSPPLLSGDSIAYLASIGFSRYNINQKSDSSANSMQLEGAIDAVITRADLEAGRYDSAQFQVLIVNWSDLTQGCLIEMTGSFGPVTINEFGWSVELRGMSYLLTRTGGEVCQPDCRVDFGSQGSGMCNKDVTALMQSGIVVDASSNNESLSVSGIVDDGNPHDGGLITFTGGANQNLSMEVKQVDFTQATPVITLMLAPFLPIEADDTFALQPACDKTMAGPAGCSFWENADNFQGEAHVPGEDNDLLFPDYQEPHG